MTWGRRLSSDELMNSTWHDSMPLIDWIRRTTSRRAFTVLPLMDSSASPAGSSPRTQTGMVLLASGRASLGHSTNLTELYRKAALISYSCEDFARAPSCGPPATPHPGG